MASFLPAVFDKKLFAGLYAGFFAAAIIGTLSHECGHYLVAKSFGRKASVHYDYTMPGHDARFQYLDSLWPKYGIEIEHHAPFPGSEQWYAVSQQVKRRDMLIILGGPLQTMLTGTAGLLLLFLFRKKYNRHAYSFLQWLPVFLALFWLRQLFNFAAGIVLYILKGHLSTRSDEAKLSLYWHWPARSMSELTAGIALIVSLVVFFRFVPRLQRLTFILAGLTGGLTGFACWEWLAGPLLLL